MANPRQQINNDYCWQENTAQWKDELGYVFMNKKWTDCTICIQNGNKKVIFPCHKLILAKSSPVFERMLFGPLAETGEEITIRDLSPILFKYLLEFAYTGELPPLKSVAKTCQLLHMADMYMMKHLKETCSVRIQQNLTAEDACLAFELCSSDPLAQETALLIMETETTAILRSECFLNARQTTVLEIVKMEYLNIDSELNLIWFVYHWAEYQIECNKGVITPENIRIILGDIFKHLRFLTVSAYQFGQYFDHINLLTVEEKYCFLKYITYNTIEFGEGFSIKTESRRLTSAIPVSERQALVRRRLQAKSRGERV